MVTKPALRLAILAGLASMSWSSSIRAAELPPGCAEAAGAAKVVHARRVESGSLSTSNVQKKFEPAKDFATVSLGDLIAVTISGLPDVLAKCPRVPIVLILNGYPLKSVRPYPPGPPNAGEPSDTTAVLHDLFFLLKITDGRKATDGTVLPNTNSGANEDWRPILNRPPWPWEKQRTVRVEIGLDDENPLKLAVINPPPTLYLKIVGATWLSIWGVGLLGIMAIFYWAIFRTNIIRNGNPAVATSINGTYSLAKAQGAWWFFVILAAYLFIGVVTGDYLSSINSTALILLGIGAGTVIGSAIIDKTRVAVDPAMKQGDVEATKLQLEQLDQRIAALDAQITASPPPPNLLALHAQRREENGQRLLLRSNYYKLTGQSEGFLTDILSDADGVSFHRFQLAVWTIILGFIFVKEVYEGLVMPEFNTTLMGLLGLSAGTYLGLKIPEATSPKN